MATTEKTRVNNHMAKPAGRIIADVLILITVAFTVYLCIIMQQRINTVVLKDTYRKIFHYELILCGILLFFTLDLRFYFLTRFSSRALRIIGTFIRFILTFLSLVIILFFCKIISGGFINTAGDARNVIVLGMALQDGKPSKDLDYRLDTAAQYMVEHPEATLILSGGNSDNTGLTEAQVMQTLLIQRGVSDDRMILEEQSSSTRENFVNTAKLLDTASPVVLITSNYHMDRSVIMAKEAGFRQCMRLPASSDPLQYGANVMWEVILEINEMVSF